MRDEGLPRLMIAAALPVILSGCAAAAIPLAAGALVTNHEMGDVVGIGVGKKRTGEGTSGSALPASPAPSRVAGGVGNSAYAAFTRYALTNAAPMAPGEVRRSALLDQDSLTTEPALADCTGQPLAVMVDLDPGAEPFDLDNPPLPAAGLAESLSTLRRAGINVLWSASLPASSADQLYNVLLATGLSADRSDHLLLPRGNGERKQTRRFDAAQDWCVLAIAGDRKADFDEAFDYLRDPESPVGRTLDSYLGAGWFLAPPPID